MNSFKERMARSGSVATQKEGQHKKLESLAKRQERQKMPKPNTIKVPWMKTPEHFKKIVKATTEGDLKVLREMVDKGLDVSKHLLERGRTLLHFAAESNQLKVANFLILSNAPVNARTEMGHTPLHLACYQGHGQMVEFLIKNGADIKAKTKTLDSCLHICAAKGRVDEGHILLSCGLSWNEKNFKGLTSLDVAMAEKQQAFVKVIKAKDAEETRKQYEKIMAEQKAKEAPPPPREKPKKKTAIQ